MGPFLAHRRNGAFITTCICHGCDWTDLEMDGKTSYAHYAAWAASLASGSAAVGAAVGESAVILMTSPLRRC